MENISQVRYGRERSAHFLKFMAWTSPGLALSLATQEQFKDFTIMTSITLACYL